MNGDMCACGRFQVELIEKHETSTMTGGSLLLCRDRPGLPRDGDELFSLARRAKVSLVISSVLFYSGHISCLYLLSVVLSMSHYFDW